MTKEQLLSNANFLIFPTNLPSNGCLVTVDMDMLNEIQKRFPNNNSVAFPIGGVYSYWNLNNHHYVMDYHKDVVLPNISEIFSLGIEKDTIAWNKITEGVPENYFIETPVWEGDEYHFVNYSTGYESTRTSLLANDNDILERTCLTPYHKLFVGGHSICTIEKVKGEHNNKNLFMVCNSQMIPSISVLAHYYKKMVIVDRRNTDFDISTLYLNETFDDVLFCLWRFCIEPVERYVNNILIF